MSDNITNQNLELFIDLSEQDQEAASAGSSGSSLNNYDFFFQKTNIDTFGSNESSISDGNSSFSTKQQTGYKLSQITIGLSGSSRQGGSRSSPSFYDMLFVMMYLLK